MSDLKKLIKYIEVLEAEPFTGCTGGYKKGYLTSCASIKKKAEKLLQEQANDNDTRDSGLHLQNVNASALIAERRKYRLEEIWNCNYEDLSDHEKFIIDNETKTLESFFDWLHSR